jgi:hypothetical protein
MARFAFALVLAVAPVPIWTATVTVSLDNTHTALGRTSTGVYDPLDIYAAPGGFGFAFLLPPIPIELPRGGFTSPTLDFNGTLTGTFKMADGWDFKAAGADLAANSLEVTSYDVFGDATRVGIEGTGGKGLPRGFAVRYTGAAQANPHWIQVIRDNHNITNNPGHGNDEHIVDSGAATPYYDDGAAADATNFFDAPSRSDSTESHYWIGALYYASAKGPGLAAQEVTILNGMLWGWGNLFFPVGDAVGAFIAQANQNLDSVAALSLAIDLDMSSYFTELQLDELQTLFNAQLASDIPEPSTFLLFGGGALALVWLRARRRSRGATAHATRA